MMRTYTNDEWIAECETRLARAEERRADVMAFRASLAIVAREMRCGNPDAAARVAFPLALVHHLPELNALVCRAVATRDELSSAGAERVACELLADTADDLQRANSDIVATRRKLARARGWRDAHG